MIYDISIPLTPQIVTWPGEPGPVRVVNGTIAQNGSETSTLTLGSHTGTHIDAPRHFVASMTEGVDSVPLDQLTGACQVIELFNIEREITRADLEQIDIHTSKIIFKTNNTTRKLLDKSDFDYDYVCLSEDAAKYLVEKHVELVGVDYLSVERKGSAGHPVHMTLLKNKIVIIEGCYLQNVPAGDYTITALPLRLVDCDGSPARVILQTV